MRMIPSNERVKHQYFGFLKEAKQLSEHSIDAVAKSLDRFESFTGGKNFKTFHPEQAVGFKRHLADCLNKRTAEKLSKPTIHTTVAHLKAFFFWLAMHPGFKSKLNYEDARYFQLSLKDTAIARGRREPRVPTFEEIRTVLGHMPFESAIEKRDRAVVAFIALTGARDDAAASMRVGDVNLEEQEVFQDARHVRTKFSKSFPTYFFPIGEDIEGVFRDWVCYLREEGFGPNNPLFPATAMVAGQDGAFRPAGLSTRGWATAAPIRKIFKEAFEAAGLSYFHPHSVRKTLVRLGMGSNLGEAGMKAWSQNLGHEDVQTTYRSYGELPAHVQRELVRGAARTQDDDRIALELGRELLSSMRAKNLTPR